MEDTISLECLVEVRLQISPTKKIEKRNYYIIGIYKYPHGVIYDGYFNKNGEFHGSGTLIYPAGQKIEGIWNNGRLTKGATFLCCGKYHQDKYF